MSEWTAYMQELTGATANVVVREVPNGIRGIVADNTRRLAVTGPCQVTWREGVRRLVEQGAGDDPTGNGLAQRASRILAASAGPTSSELISDDRSSQLTEGQVMTHSVFDNDIDEMVARVRIQDLFVKFSRGVDRGEWDLIRGVLFSDARLVHGPFAGSPEEFIAWSAPFHDGVEYSQHFDSNIQIDFASPTAAMVEVYVLAFYGYGPTGRNPGGTAVADGSAGMRMQILNRYLDSVEYRDGRWAIAEHTFVHVDRMTENLDTPITAPDGYLHSSRGPADPLHHVAARLGIGVDGRATATGR